jgi:hypothetical protein
MDGEVGSHTYHVNVILAFHILKPSLKKWWPQLGFGKT